MMLKHWIRRISLVAVMVLAVSVLAACGDDDERPAEDGTAVPTVEDATAVPTAATTGDTTGVSDTEIKLGSHLPLSESAAAAYAVIGDGMRAYFDYINDTEGGVHGRKITFIVGDDHYMPADTVEVVRELVEQDEVFAIVGGLGEETHLAVYKYLEERGVPDLFINSGIQIWTDPVAKTRFGGTPSYLQEGAMLGQYVAENHPGARLGLLIQNNDFGFEGEEGVRNGIEGSDVEIVAVETYEEVDFDAAPQTQRLKNADVDVVVAWAIPPQAASLVKTAREVLNWDVPVLISGVNASDIFVQLAGVENAEGIVSVVFGYQTWQTDHPGVQQYLEVMETYAPGVPVENFSEYGYAMAEVTVEALKRVGPELTREGLVDALEAMRGFLCSLCFEPISMSPTDHRPVEIEVYIRLQDGIWVPFGEPVSYESTP
jgi:ABC-type branched-subunit amino acid transport system substrate-binding protein